MSYLVGKIALDIDAGAPNNGEGEDNVGVVKSVRVGRDRYPYVSAQAFRRWLRDSIPATEPRSPVTRVAAGRNQQAYTGARPDLYFDDDLFGYMVAEKVSGIWKRETVLATGTLLSVAPAQVSKDFGTMSRGFAVGDNPVIHQHELYSAELAGDILLDLPRIGTFELDGNGLRRNLTPAAVTEAVRNGATETDFRGGRSLQLPLAERRRRAALLLRTLAEVRGGAKNALHYGDRAPALVLLAPLKGGNNPFTRVLRVNSRDKQVIFDPAVFREELTAWDSEIDGQVLLGWAPGFLGTQREDAVVALEDLVKDEKLVIGHPRTLTTALAGQIESGACDAWFEDPQP
jgi:CRISPR-associated protein Cas7/Cst2/DevR subtype I-B